MLFLTILKHLSTNPEKLAEGHGSSGDQQEAGMGHGRGSLAVSEMVSRHTHIDRGQQSSGADHSDHIGHTVRHDGGRAQGNPHQQVSLNPEVGCRLDRGGCHDYGCVTSQGAGGQAVLASTNTAGQHSLADIGHPIQTRILAQISPSRANPAHGLRQQILKAVYHNSCNHCYLNAWIRALASASIAVFGDTRALGSFRECIMQYHEPGALVNGQVRLMQPAFRALLECWPQPDAQNDIFEFAAHFMQAAGTIQVFGEWQHRDVHAGSLRVRDRGHVVSFYLRGHASHTALWTQWRSQDAHAFISPPCIILAQVMRFQPDGAGRLRRRTGCVTHLAAEVDVPIFAERSTSVLHHPYRPCAILLHSGINGSLVGKRRNSMYDECACMQIRLN